MAAATDEEEESEGNLSRWRKRHIVAAIMKSMVVDVAKDVYIAHYWQEMSVYTSLQQNCGTYWYFLEKKVAWYFVSGTVTKGEY